MTAAADLSVETGHVLAPIFILSWAAVESGFGTSNISRTNNNYFGEKDLVNCGPKGDTCAPNTNPDHHARWAGAIPCRGLGANANAGFACFDDATLGASGYAAIFNGNGRILSIAKSMPDASVAQLGQAIANGGYCKEGQLP
jgi:hypothetical protein